MAGFKSPSLCGAEMLAEASKEFAGGTLRALTSIFSASISGLPSSGCARARNISALVSGGSCSSAVSLLNRGRFNPLALLNVRRGCRCGLSSKRDLIGNNLMPN